MIDSPVIYFDKDLVFGKDKSCWAIYEVNGYNYELLSNELKIKMLQRLTRFVSSIKMEAKILIIPMKQNTKEHFSNLKKRPINDDDLREKRNIILDSTEEYLEKSLENYGNVNEYRTYIVVKMIKEVEYTYSQFYPIKEAYDYFVKSPVNAINVFMNLGVHDILESRLKTFSDLAKRFLEENAGRLSLKPVDTSKTQWLLRRAAFRGLDKDVKMFYKSNEEEWKPYNTVLHVDNENIIKPYYRDTVNLFSGVIKKSRSKRHIEVEHSDGSVSYQTFLSITNIPDIMEFPSCEWLYVLQQKNMQSEICIHIKNIEHKESIRKVSKKREEAKGQMNNAGEFDADDIPYELMETRLETDMLEAELKSGRLPLCDVSVSICVSADNLKEMEEKATSIITEYEDQYFTIERSLADQLKLYFHFFPGTSTGVKDYVMNLTPTALSSGIFGASNFLGDDVGYYLGTTGQARQPVFLDMGLACRMNQSASATFFGGLGFGKSFNTNLLVHLNFMDGGYNLIFDPKGERSHFADFPLYKDHINIVTLDNDKRYKGTLDPYNIYPDDIAEANNLVLNVLCEYYSISSKDNEYIVLAETCGLMTEKSKSKSFKPSMEAFCKLIDEFDSNDELKPHAIALSRRLKILKQVGLSQLIMGDGTEKAIKLDSRINILQIQNLALPSPDTQKADYTQEEILSSVIMLIMGNFAKKFALQKFETFSLILFDESWMLKNTAEGVKLYEFLSRMGRSLYFGCIFNGHSVLDIATEAIRNAITYKFCFNTNSKDEAERMLKYLGLEVTASNIELVQSLGNGQCLFQDAFRRVGVLTFDAVFQDLITLFSTTPTLEKGSNIKESQEQSAIEAFYETEVFEESLNDNNIVAGEEQQELDELLSYVK